MSENIDIKELEVMFPEREFSLTEKHTIKIRPLSLEDLPKVSQAFADVAKLVGERKTMPEITVAGMTELLKISKYCLNVPPRVIPIDKVPEVLTHIVELNMNEAVVKKWMTLLDLINKEFVQGEVENKVSQE